MPHLSLLDKSAQKPHRIGGSEAVVGRDPSCAIFVEGESAKTVSGRHARFFLDDGKWYVEDAGSRNGTYVGGKRLDPGTRHAVAMGDVIGLGLTGTQLLIQEVVGRNFAATMLEAPTPSHGVAGGTVPMRRSEALRAGIHELGDVETHEEVRIILRGVQSGARLVAQSDRITIGRALDCLIRVEGESAISVSRVHTEVIAINGKASVRDAGSRHGTFINGKKLEAPAQLKHGDLLMLGPGGPTFSVDDVGTLPAGSSPPVSARSTDDHPHGQAAGSHTPPSGNPSIKDSSAPRGADEAFMAELPTPGLARPAIKAPRNTPPKTPPPKTPPSRTPRPGKAAVAPGPATRLARASGVGRTALFRNVLNEVSEKSAKRVRVAIWSAVGMFIVVATATVTYATRKMDQTDAELAQTRIGFNQQAAALDSLRASATHEAQIARASLDSAMGAAAPAAVLDSLRGALADADRRATGLEESLKRARASVDAQLGAADSIRRAAEGELARLKAQVASAQATGGAYLDSLQRTYKAAEERAKEASAQDRAVKGADLPKIAQLNQGAVGMVTIMVGRDQFDGSGFVISPSGHFLTNRHVIQSAAGAADSIYVTMSDRSVSYRADIVLVAPESGPDVAVLKIRNYKGPVVAKIDWTGSHAVQGEGAALIGFPAGYDLAMDAEAKVVRSSMTAGIFSKVTPEQIQFAGLSVGGSSGSPLFNGAGEVVGLHRAGLREGPGLGFAVPLAKVLTLLPENLRAELGIAK